MHICHVNSSQTIHEMLFEKHPHYIFLIFACVWISMVCRRPVCHRAANRAVVVQRRAGVIVPFAHLYARIRHVVYTCV